MTPGDRLFQRYNSELTFIRDLAKDFAARYPGVAGRLALDAKAQSNDPHVERLIEAFALLTANVQVKLEDEFPELTDALLQVLYPHYVAPLPSMAVVRFELNPGAADSPAGFTLPRHSAMETDPVNGVPCRYRTGYPITLWPLEVVDAKLREPPYPPGLEPPGDLRNEIQSYLSLKVQCTGSLSFEQLELDTLRLFLLGGAQVTVGLYESLFTELRHVVILPENRKLPPARIPVGQRVRPVGFDADEALLPYPKQAFAGYRLLTEFFAYPTRFSFVDVGGWKFARELWAQTANEKGPPGRSAEIVFYFDRPPREGLALAVKKGTFVTGCAPVINLFDKVAEGIPLTHRKSEYVVDPDVHAPHGYEVYSVDEVSESDPSGGEPKAYRPFYSFRHDGGPSGPPFWYVSRRPRFRQKVDGRPDREASVGTDAYLRLVDLGLDPHLPTEGRTVSVRTTCLNRDLPRLLKGASEQLQFNMLSAAPVRARCLAAPTPTMRPPVGRKAAWRLLSHLNLNYLSLGDADQGAAALQEYLRLYDFADARADPEQSTVAVNVVSGLTSLRSERAVEFVETPAGGAFARGVAIAIDLDDEKFAGVGSYLFASVIERFLALYASVNSFSKLTARTNRPGAGVWTWNARAGEQELV